ncbi:MAG: efflux RND transporter permease subunit, partial [Candidatus Omnitrophota bacterium]
SFVGFFSLSFSPIPPVQTFGVFVAIGIMIAWLLTISFIPAYISLMREAAFDNFGKQIPHTSNQKYIIDRLLGAVCRFSLRRAKSIVVLSLIVVIASIYGITKISVNDNPVRWFSKSHPIRVSDKVLNQHFGGTYTAYMILEAKEKGKDIFIEPQTLRYIEGLQGYLAGQGLVGKTTSLADVVKKVYYELLGGDKINNVIPATKRAVAQCLISYENSHKPDDLWHMTTPDYSKVNIWFQLKSGDNKDMGKVIRQVDDYFNSHKAPFEFKSGWAGLTYINLVWQNKMVRGMLNNFLGSFIIVFFMMTFLFRSPLRGLISMMPLMITILFIYSLLGFFGKDYDMPVAVLSALTLGLSVDFAIHFIQRAREIFQEEKGWDKTAHLMFGGPARAITRNTLVIAIGFLPLLIAPLVPYRTVGFFMFTIMFVSSIATLIILPAIITLVPGVVFQEQSGRFFCNRKYCIVISFAVSLTIAYVLQGYTNLVLRPTLLISAAIIAVMAGVCAKISRKKFCITDKKEE